MLYVYRNAYSWIRYPGLNGSIFYDIILTASVYSSVCFLLFSSNNQLQRDEKIKIFICISCMPDNWNPNNLYCSASNSIRRVVHSGIFKLYFMIHIITEEILIWIWKVLFKLISTNNNTSWILRVSSNKLHHLGWNQFMLFRSR